MAAVLLLAAACRPYDFDNDGYADYGYVDMQGRFWIEGHTEPIFEPPEWGTPVSGDYHGHVVTEAAVVTDDGRWYIAGEDEPRQFGPDDLGPDAACVYSSYEELWIPVPGNYDPATPTWELAWYQSCDAIWYVEGQDPAQFGIGRADPSTTPPSPNDEPGLWADIPVPADYDGDGITEIAVFRVLDGTFRTLEDGVIADFGAVGFPAPGDYRPGDPGVEPALLAWHHGGWLVEGEAPVPVALEVNGELVVPADYDGEPGDEVRLWDWDLGGFRDLEGNAYAAFPAAAGTGAPVTTRGWQISTALRQTFVHALCSDALALPGEEPEVPADEVCPPGVDPPTWPEF